MTCRVGPNRFGRAVDVRWLKSTTVLERVQYGYDRAGNRTFRDNLAASGGQDEFYTYDNLSRLTNMDRGDLNGGRTAISGTPAREEDFNFDPTGNWNGSPAYLTKTSGTTDLSQTRTHSKANEVTGITQTVPTPPPSWPTPAQDLVGNMTTLPQPLSLGNNYACKYDAWNRLVEVKDGGTTVATYVYDGLHRRVKKVTGETRHYYYSAAWQVLEERVGSATTAERQFVWGLRYADDLILRDRDTDANGSLDQRHYALHDYFHVTAIVNTSGAVQERYGYDSFGTVRFMDASFGAASSSYAWETLYGAYRYDAETGLYHVRHRYLHAKLGRWITRDPIGYRAGVNLNGYVANNPDSRVDSDGLQYDGTQVGVSLVFNPNPLPGGSTLQPGPPPTLTGGPYYPGYGVGGLPSFVPSPVIDPAGFSVGNSIYMMYPQYNGWLMNQIYAQWGLRPPGRPTVMISWPPCPIQVRPPEYNMFGQFPNLPYPSEDPLPPDVNIFDLISPLPPFQLKPPFPILMIPPNTNNSYLTNINSLIR